MHSVRFPVGVLASAERPLYFSIYFGIGKVIFDNRFAVLVAMKRLGYDDLINQVFGLSSTLRALAGHISYDFCIDSFYTNYNANVIFQCNLDYLKKKKQLLALFKCRYKNRCFYTRFQTSSHNFIVCDYMLINLNGVWVFYLPTVDLAKTNRYKTQQISIYSSVWE